MAAPNLYMILIGCTPKGRHIEQHDIFFGIAENIKTLVPAIIDFWPEAEGKMHIDGWREVKNVDGYSISVVPKTNELVQAGAPQLFFLNLGGYKQNEFEAIKEQYALHIIKDENAAEDELHLGYFIFSKL